MQTEQGNACTMIRQRRRQQAGATQAVKRGQFGQALRNGPGKLVGFKDPVGDHRCLHAQKQTMQETGCSHADGMAGRGHTVQ